MKAHNEQNSVQFADEVAAAPGVPAAGAGTDISALRTNNGGNSARYQRIRLTASETQTLAGPVEFGGEVDGKVYYIGKLNNGDDIVMAAGKGYAEVTQFVGTYDRFWLNPAGISAGNYSNRIMKSMAHADGWVIWCPACHRGHVIDIGLSFNGDASSPTFAPSVVVPSTEQHVSAKGVKGEVLHTVCHFSVTDGEIKFFNDSTHAMAGQTVMLPDEFVDDSPQPIAFMIPDEYEPEPAEKPEQLTVPEPASEQLALWQKPYVQATAAVVAVSAIGVAVAYFIGWI
jgi:hypothetical protein